MMKPSVIIIGGGASGLMCAIEAGKRGHQVIILEHNDALAKKVLISGGGRCNFTNIDVSPENYFSTNPHFVRSALSRFTPETFLSFLDKHNVSYHEKDNGKFFCRESAKELVDALRCECKNLNVQILLDHKILSVKRLEPFIIETDHGKFESPKLVVATGGLSYSNLGASDLGCRIAQQFGLNVIDRHPGLVPLLFNERDRKKYASLSGASFNAKVSCKKKSFDGDVLFTHKGLSGPAILQISSCWRVGDTIEIDLFPEKDLLEILCAKKSAGSKMELKTILAGSLPKRFAEILCSDLASKEISSFSKGEIVKIARDLQCWEFLPSGTEGYSKAEVTSGGVDTKEISSKTMESKKISGLYFIGEVLDVTGQLGGYNLHWAWASGFAAGNFI